MADTQQSEYLRREMPSEGQGNGAPQRALSGVSKVGTTFSHDRYRYTCLSCMSVVTVVVPLKATIGMEYDCRQCARRTPWQVEYLKGTGR